MEHQFNKFVKKNLKTAVGEARDTEESTSQEDKKQSPIFESSSTLTAASYQFGVVFLGILWVPRWRVIDRHR